MQVRTLSYSGALCSCQTAGVKLQIVVSPYCLQMITAFDTGSLECIVSRIFSILVFCKPLLVIMEASLPSFVILFPMEWNQKHKSILRQKNKTKLHPVFSLYFNVFYHYCIMRWHILVEKMMVHWTKETDKHPLMHFFLNVQWVWVFCSVLACHLLA